MSKLRMIWLSTAATAMLLASAPAALAEDRSCPHQFGSHQRLTDAGGAAVQEWTVTGLHASEDAVPGYPVVGRLWEATVTIQAAAGTVTPILPNVQAVSPAGDHYPMLWQVASPAGVPGTTLAEGQMSTGKMYFDVAGAAPDAVVYPNAGMEPLMMWCDDPVMMAKMAAAKVSQDCP